MIKKCVVSLLAVSVGGCASLTPTYQTESSFVIYDVPSAHVDRNQLLNAIQTTVQRRSSKARVNRDIPPATLPETPGRFELQEPFANSGLGAMMAAQGQRFRVPVCKNALMTMSTDDTAMAAQGEKTTFFLCVLPYQSGYHIDIYATFTRRSGGFSPQALAAATVRSVAGDSSQSIPRTMNEVRQAVESVAGPVVVVDRYIPDAFKGLFIDDTQNASR